ncbi:MAG: hypothetical protein H6650_21270 [Ardenticatenales bacterium]|nr:hypothetical protein [Ardenticatenales bacterium]
MPVSTPAQINFTLDIPQVDVVASKHTGMANSSLRLQVAAKQRRERGLQLQCRQPAKTTGSLLERKLPKSIRATNAAGFELLVTALTRYSSNNSGLNLLFSHRRQPLSGSYARCPSSIKYNCQAAAFAGFRMRTYACSRRPDPAFWVKFVDLARLRPHIRKFLLLKTPTNN